MGAVASSQEFARFHRAEPVLITEAQPSLRDQHAARKRRYVITMAVRAVSLVLAAVVISTTHIMWLGLIFALLGTVLPWVAVVMANDGPPKKREHPNRYDARPDRVLENPKARVIEG
jgi:Flp pilus assembly protein TadB